MGLLSFLFRRKSHHGSTVGAVSDDDSRAATVGALAMQALLPAPSSPLDHLIPPGMGSDLLAFPVWSFFDGFGLQQRPPANLEEHLEWRTLSVSSYFHGFVVQPDPIVSRSGGHLGVASVSESFNDFQWD